MKAARPVPRVGSVHSDVRGDDRALRVSLHPESGSGVVVLSIWRDNVCTGTVRLAAEDVPDLIVTLGQAIRTPMSPAERPPLLA
ncbi:MAG: hypothetical protein FWE71_13475 [Nocardioidaceae bacterium]|nr:hypothetical protein [Nocardioidaceae bacterium]